MRVVSTHKGTALVFLSEESIEATIIGLQKLKKHGDYPAVQLHYAESVDGESTAIIKRLKRQFRDEPIAGVTRRRPVWEEDRCGE